MLIRLQYAFFFNKPMTDGVDLMIRLREGMGDILDGEPMLMPMPQGAPGDLPFMSMNSRDGKCQINASAVRLDCVTSKGEESPAEYGSFTEGVLEKLRSVLADFKWARFGCTATMFDRTDQPIERIAGEYVKRDLADSCNEIHLRFNEPREVDGTVYNHVISVQNGFKESLFQEPTVGVITALDINTHASITKIGDEQINSVLSQISGDPLVLAESHE